MKKKPANNLLDHENEHLAVSNQSEPEKTVAKVNGHYLPDEDDEEVEEDLILGDEAEIEDVDYNEDNFEVEVDDELDEDDIDEDDLVLDMDEDIDDEEDNERV